MENLLSPIAECQYPFIFVPSTQFNPEGTYEIDLILDPSKNEEHKTFLKTLHALWVETKGKNPFYKHEKDLESGTDTGRLIVKFKSKFPVTVFDSNKVRINYDRNIIGNGSKVRISYTTKPHTKDTGGLSKYITGLQIIDLIEYEGGTADGFGFDTVEDGYKATQNIETAIENHFADDSNDNLTDSNNADPVDPNNDLPF